MHINESFFFNQKYIFKTRTWYLQEAYKENTFPASHFRRGFILIKLIQHISLSNILIIFFGAIQLQLAVDVAKKGNEKCPNYYTSKEQMK